MRPLPFIVAVTFSLSLWYVISVVIAAVLL